jgi:signal transduction histidine kinase
LQELTEHNIFGRLSQLDEEWVLFFASEDAKTTRLATVTHFMDTQQRLARIRFLSALFFAGLTFLISRFFVKSALVRLWELTRFVKQIDIHKLGQRLPLQGPQDDEIREISVAINSAIDTIQQQTSSLKDFVSYASHELKTPLMSMNSNLDLAEKTQDF